MYVILTDVVVMRKVTMVQMAGIDRVYGVWFFW